MLLHASCSDVFPFSYLREDVLVLTVPLSSAFTVRIISHTICHSENFDEHLCLHLPEDEDVRDGLGGNGIGKSTLFDFI